MTAPSLRRRDAAPFGPPPAAPVRTPEPAALPGALLDDVLALVQRDPASALALLVPGLRSVFDALPPAGWDAFTARCLTHPLAAVLREDPFTARAFAKPRGYPGDAGILDLIYGAVPLPAGTTALGAALYAENVRAPACESVRYRRDMLADAIDAAAAATSGRARVLSVACGHLREAECAESVRDGQVAAFYALDQDPVSVELLREQHEPLGVTPVLASVKDVIVGRARFDRLTLAYAAGLYDYLPTPVAARLTARLFEALAPGGRLIVANFCPETRDRAYMDAVMDWRLIYRGEAEMAEIAAAVPGTEVARQRLYRDLGGNVVYLEMDRA